MSLPTAGLPADGRFAALTATHALVLLLLASCATAKPESVAATLANDWRSMKAEHSVTLEVEGQKRSLRGAVAIERPGRLRLRALGPGGIHLFDLLATGGRTSVIEPLRDPKSNPAFGAILEALAGDLSAAYDLEPRPAARSRSIAATGVVIDEPGRTVKLSDFRRIAGHAVFHRAEIVNHSLKYRVVVEVGSVELDEPLDPQLFLP